MLLLSLFDNVKCHVDASAVTYFKVFDWLLILSFMNILVALKKRFALQGNLLWLSIVWPSNIDVNTGFWISFLLFPRMLHMCSQRIKILEKEIQTKKQQVLSTKSSTVIFQQTTSIFSQYIELSVYLIILLILYITPRKYKPIIHHGAFQSSSRSSIYLGCLDRYISVS